MATLIFKNTSTTTALAVNDLGIYLAANEESDLIVNFRNEDLIESTELEAAMTGTGEVWLDGITELTYAELIDYLTSLTKYDTIDYAYISSKDTTTDITAAELEALTDGSEVTGHIHDGRYYTEVELGVSNSGTVSIHWDNITNAPAGGEVNWKTPVDRTDTSYGAGDVLPTVDNVLNDARMVADDGDGSAAQYVCVAIAGAWTDQWVKIADVDWGDSNAISVTPLGNIASSNVQDALYELQGDIDTINTIFPTIDLDYAYDNGSVVTVDNTSVDFQITDTKKFIVSDSVAAPMFSVAANSAGDIVTINANVDINAGTFTVDATGASHIIVDNNSLLISTTTSGNITISPVGDLLLKDQYLTSAIKLSETGVTALDVSITATSIIGAINELATSGGFVNTLDEAYDEGGSGAGRVIIADSGSVQIDATSSTYAPLELTSQSSAPASGLAAGQLSVINGELYIYDATRSKWLSSTEMHYSWSNSVADGKYLSIGDAHSTAVGYVVPVNATLVKVALSIGSGLNTKTFELRKNGVVTPLKSFSAIAGEYYSVNDNIDLVAGDIIQIYASGVGLAAKAVVASIYLKWRK